MRVLTVRQPWAWAIVHGGKDVENRVRSLGPYTGPVAIHVALKGYDPSDLRWLRAPLGDGPMERADRLGVREAIIGVVDLVDGHRCRRLTGCKTGREAHDNMRRTLCSPWAEDGDVWHLVLADPRPLTTPIPATGRLGLWRPDPDLLDAIQAQIGGA